MATTGINLQTLLPATKIQAEVLAKTFAGGDVIKATVISVNQAHGTTLHINGKQIQVKSPVELALGQQIQLTVSKDGKAHYSVDKILQKPALLLLAETNKLPQQIFKHAKTSIINAKILTISANNTVLFSIGKTTIKGQLSTALLENQNIKLAVLSKGEKTVFQIKSAVTTEDVKNVYIKHNLQKQNDITPLLKVLRNIQYNPQLPKSIQKSIHQLIQSLPNKNTLTNSKGIINALSKSGIVTESSLKKLLANSTTVTSPTTRPTTSSTATTTATTAVAAALLTGDLKLNLLQLLQTFLGIKDIDRALLLAPPKTTEQLMHLPQLGPFILAKRLSTASQQTALSLKFIAEIIRQIESVIARIQLHQLSSLPAADSAEPNVWLFEIPLREKDQDTLLKLRLRKEAATADNKEHRWEIDLAVDLKNIGPLHIKLRLQGNKIQTTLWSENSSSADVFNAHLELLNTAYEKCGLVVDQTVCFHGKPPTQDNNAVTENSTLLDEHA